MLHELLDILWSECILKLKQSQCWGVCLAEKFWFSTVTVCNMLEMWSKLMYGWNSFFSLLLGNTEKECYTMQSVCTHRCICER